MAKRRPPMQFDLSGFPAIHKVLKELGKQHGNTVERRLARAALGAGLTEAARIIRREAPKRTRIRKAVGQRFKKNRRRGIHEAKAGLNVGKKHGSAPHAHFFVLGTARRRTKRGENRGKVRPNYFVRRAIELGDARIQGKMFERIMKRLPLEIARARRKAGAPGKIEILPGPSDGAVIVGDTVFT